MGDDSAATLRRMLHPVILLYCDLRALNELIALNKNAHDSLIGDGKATSGYWQAVCNSFCALHGLYSPVIVNPTSILHMDYRQHFLKTLLPLRAKWNTFQREQEVHKIRVACRFRPGELSSGKVCLPLHQFIRVRRKQQAEQNNKENQDDQNDQTGRSKKLFVGEEDPEEFKDPFLGGLMRDPVLLLSSNRVVSRAVAVQCILRGGRDPFNNQRLAMNMLIPQPDLAEKIQAWREKKGQRDVAVDVSDLKGLVDCAAFDAECFDALLDLQRLHLAAKKAMVDAQGVPQWANEDAQAVQPDLAVAADVGADPHTGPEDDAPFAGNAAAAAATPWAVDITDPAQTIVQEEDEVFRRPSKSGEAARIVEVHSKNAFVAMHVPGAGVQPFHFHAVLEGAAGQKDVYDGSVQDAISAALNGCNACILCYGQTGSGKTFTFLGPEGHLEDSDLNGLCSNDDAAQNDVDLCNGLAALPAASGMVLRAAQEIFSAREALLRGQGITMTCALQIVEIYEEKVTDLLTGRNVTVRRESGLVQGATETLCESLADLLPVLKLAHSRQRFAETAMNQRSSRAHTVLVWQLVQRRPVGFGPSGEPEFAVVESHLHLVDLAGSERVKKSQVTGQHLREAVGINASLLVLGKVISALERQQHHVPYLECKLTTLLRAAFGGNSRTTVVVNARSDEEHGDETLQSLRFGWRCSNISNQLKSRATSLQATVEAIDQAMLNVKTQLDALARHGKQQLDSYKALAQSFEMMQVKRRELLASHGNPVFEPKPPVPAIVAAGPPRPEIYL